MSTFILDPAAEQLATPPHRPIAARLDGLMGKRLAFVDNGFLSTQVLHDELRDALASSGVVTIVVSKKYWRPITPEGIAALAADVDAVVSGVCNTPPSTTWGVIDSTALERLGTPTVTLATTFFEDLLRETAAGEGVPDLRYVMLPHPMEDRPDRETRAIARESVERLLSALVNPAGQSGAAR